MTSLSPLERKALKARAHHLKPVVLIGEAGLTPAVLREISIALDSHELIKVRMTGDDRAARIEAHELICAELSCAPVQHIGKLMVLYRPKPLDPAAAAVTKPRRPSGPRKTKKQLAQQATKPAAKRAGTTAADRSSARETPARRTPARKTPTRTTAARKTPARKQPTWYPAKAPTRGTSRAPAKRPAGRLKRT